MKLVDSNKRFQFIKNQQVEIDGELLKYQKLKVIAEAGEAYGSVEPENPVSRNTHDITLPVMQNGRRVMPPTINDIDDRLRKLVAEMKSNEIREYLGSESAEAFNGEFLPILSGEVSVNRGTLVIPSNRWLNECSTPFAEAEPTEDGNSRKPTMLERIKGFFAKRDEEKTEKERSKDSITLLDLFDVIHVEADKAKEFIDRIEGYFKLITNAHKMHQEAQLDEICQHIIIDVYESVLAAHGLNRYITFGNIEKLQGKCNIVLDIDYLKNFGRVIPDSVVEKKIKVDEMCVFDNYCVLYFDPNKTAYKATAKEKRDPILFGLINHSDKLYYIDSWEDELCDLTLDKIAEKLGDGVIETIK